MAPTLSPNEISLEALHYIPKRAVVDALRINPTQRYVSSDHAFKPIEVLGRPVSMDES